jgi:hypothetical protein
MTTPAVEVRRTYPAVCMPPPVPAASDRMSRPPSRSGCSPVLGDSLTAEQYPTSTRPTHPATAVIVSTNAAAGRGPIRAACRRATTSATRPAQRRRRIDPVRISCRTSRDRRTSSCTYTLRECPAGGARSCCTCGHRYPGTVVDPVRVPPPTAQPATHQTCQQAAAGRAVTTPRLARTAVPRRRPPRSPARRGQGSNTAHSPATVDRPPPGRPHCRLQI